MRDSIYIGESPYEESCAQLGTDGYEKQAKLEIEAYILQLRRMFPDTKCKFVMKSNQNDFGVYYNVDAVYDDSDEQSMKDAFRAEAESPERWDDEAKAWLALSDDGRQLYREDRILRLKRKFHRNYKLICGKQEDNEHTDK